MFVLKVTRDIHLGPDGTTHSKFKKQNRKLIKIKPKHTARFRAQGGRLSRVVVVPPARSGFSLSSHAATNLNPK